MHDASLHSVTFSSSSLTIYIFVLLPMIIRAACRIHGIVVCMKLSTVYDTKDELFFTCSRGRRSPFI
jgi:hypothetical protein